MLTRLAVLGVLCLGPASAFHANGAAGFPAMTPATLGGRQGFASSRNSIRSMGHSLLIPLSRARQPKVAALATMMDDDIDIDGIGADYESSGSKETDQYATCGSCRASYMIDPLDLGEGRRVKCEVCEHTWFQSASRLVSLKKSDKVKPFPVDQWKLNKEKLGNIVTKHERKGAVTLFVGNMPFSITEEKLKEVFSKHGEVASLSIICDPSTGRPKGYGFVDYVEKESGQKALDNIDGMSIDGRELAIKTSEDRYDFGGGRGGRGDFRGGRGDRGRGGGDFRGRGRGGDRGGDRGGYSDRGARDGAETNNGRDASGKFVVKKKE